eukprot:scaffold408162_cov22-Prasinocladus_malaysianus.AAC.2
MSDNVTGNSGSAQLGPWPIIAIGWTFPFEHKKLRFQEHIGIMIDSHSLIMQGGSVLQASAQLDGGGDPGPPPTAEF